MVFFLFIFLKDNSCIKERRRKDSVKIYPPPPLVFASSKYQSLGTLHPPNDVPQAYFLFLYGLKRLSLRCLSCCGCCFCCCCCCDCCCSSCCCCSCCCCSCCRCSCCNCCCGWFCCCCCCDCCCSSCCCCSCCC